MRESDINLLHGSKETITSGCTGNPHWKIRTAMIESLEKVRFDQQLILESMSPQEIWQLSGRPVRVKTVRWTNSGDAASYTSSYGLTVLVTTDRNYLAVVEPMDEAWSRSRLLIINADGTVRAVMKNSLDLQNGPTLCNFVGLTEAIGAPASVFTVVAVPLTMDPFSISQRVDIDAKSGEILSIRESR